MRITDFPELIAPTGNDLLVTVDIANDLTKKVKLDNLPISLPALTALATKQDSLVSGTNIKTINSTSLLGSGNITIAANPSGVAGAIQFSDGSAFSSDAANFFWDDTNNRLGVGTNSPLCGLDVSQNINGDVFARLRNTNAGGFGMLLNAGSGVGTYAMQWANYQGSGGGRLYPEGVYIGQQSAPTARLQVRGSGSTSATTSLLVQNSSGVASLQVTDDGSVYNLGKNAIASNTAFGRLALIANTTGSGNTAMGQSSLNANNTGVYNTAFGFSSMNSNQNGTSNVAVGYEAAFSNVFGSGITAIGYQALRQGGGAKSTAIGHSSLFNNAGENNTAVGYEAAKANSTGTGVTAIGYQSLLLSTGGENTAVGYQAGLNITTGTQTTALGYQALAGAAGSRNTGLGYAALTSTTGAFNTAVGRQALSNNTTGNSNTAIGENCQSGNFSGSVILGKDATATAANQCVFGSTGTNAGAVTTATALQTKTWDVIINGVAQKILLA
jgi:T5SS/PEP-CTERM-associated repeat protein